MKKGLIALGTTSIFTIGAIYFVHWDQQYQKDLMRQGVLKDIERDLAKQKQINAKTEENE